MRNVLKIKDESHYYPFGLKHNNYNVEYLEFQQIDVYVGNIHIKIIDPDGKRWLRSQYTAQADAMQAIAEEIKVKIAAEQYRLKNELEIKKEIGDIVGADNSMKQLVEMNARSAVITEFISNIEALGNYAHASFTFHVPNSADGRESYNLRNDKKKDEYVKPIITIEYGSMGIKFHEIKHAYQLITGNRFISFNSFGKRLVKETIGQQKMSNKHIDYNMYMIRL